MNVPRQPRRHLTAPPWRSSRTEAQLPVDVDEARDTADDRGPGDVIILSQDEVERALDVFPVERAPVLLVNQAPRQEIAAADLILELAPAEADPVEAKDLVLDPTAPTRRIRTRRISPRHLVNALMIVLFVGLSGAIGVAIHGILSQAQPSVAKEPALGVPAEGSAEVAASPPPENKFVAPPEAEKPAIADSAPAIAAIPADAAPARSDSERPVIGEQQRTVEPPVRADVRQPAAQTITPSITDAAVAIATDVPVVLPEPVPPATPTAAPRVVETFPSPPEPVAAPPNVAAASPEPAPVEPLPPPRLTETGAIRNVLRQYQSAFNDLDTRAAREIWPTVNTRALDRAFAQLETQQLEFDRCDIDVTGVRAVAACGGRTRYVPKLGNKNPQAQRRQWTFDLRKINDAWLIEGVDSR